MFGAVVTASFTLVDSGVAAVTARQIWAPCSLQIHLTDPIQSRLIAMAEPTGRAAFCFVAWAINRTCELWQQGQCKCAVLGANPSPLSSKPTQILLS